MNPDANDPLTEMEIHIAHVQRLYEQLDEVVREQAVRFDRMERRVAELQNRFRELKEKQVPETDSLDEKPPHY